MQKIFISAIQYFSRNKDREYWPTGKICLITDRKNSNPYREGIMKIVTILQIRFIAHWVSYAMRTM